MSGSDALNLRLRRTGGQLGGSRLELEIDADELDDKEASALRRAVGEGGFARFKSLPSQGVGADEYQYDLIARSGDDVVTLRFDETRVPEALMPLLEALERRADAATRPRRDRDRPDGRAPSSR